MSMTIASQFLDHSQSYPEYREMIDALLAQQKTTGGNHRPDMLEYTQLNARKDDASDRSEPGPAAAN